MTLLTKKTRRYAGVEINRSSYILYVATFQSPTVHFYFIYLPLSVVYPLFNLEELENEKIPAILGNDDEIYRPDKGNINLKKVERFR